MSEQIFKGPVTMDVLVKLTSTIYPSSSVLSEIIHEATAECFISDKARTVSVFNIVLQKTH
jgi:hypothetical protein